MVQRLDIRDTLGLVGEAPGLPAGMIVSAWNPDEGWERDALLRVNATKGVPTADLTVWQLVDVMVHPLGVHIVQHVANSVWVGAITEQSNCCIVCFSQKAPNGV